MGTKRKHDSMKGHSSIDGAEKIQIEMDALSPEEAGDENTKRRQPSPSWTTVTSKRSKNKSKNTYPELTYSPTSRLQQKIKIQDLQGLVLYLLANGPAPQWISVRNHSAIRKVVVLMVPGLEQGLFNGEISLAEKTEDNSSDLHQKNHPNTISPTSADYYLPTKLADYELPKPLVSFASIFQYIWPVSSPGDGKTSRLHSPLQAMLSVPITKSKEEKGVGRNTASVKPAWKDNVTAISHYLMTAEELSENNFNIHPALLPPNEADKAPIAADWKYTKVEKLEDGIIPDLQVQNGSITEGREILSMDCEMCKTQGGDLDLTRISIVNWDGKVVLNELVKPSKPIVDYLTIYSGITEALLAPVQTTLSDIQTRLIEILQPNTVLLGHSLDSDLMALKLSHPFIVDTTLLYPHPHGAPLKSSLKWLAKKFLGREIQKGHGNIGHDSIEDARACLDLVKLKCEKGPNWGTSDIESESIFKRIQRTSRPISHGGSRDGRSGAFIDWGHPEKNHGVPARVCIGCVNDAEVVSGIKMALEGDPEGRIVPGGGVDFVWARFRRLEALRGWRTDIPTIDHTLDFDNSPAIPDHTSKTELLSKALQNTADYIKTVWEALPPCTAFIVYSGSGDPTEMAQLQRMYQQHKKEFRTTKWDELTVKWTDTEEQALKAAVRKARSGIGFLAVK
ncbi:MAG: hypothetical protein M1829_002487 [Trizodia sp. TS-e1964]|nr:MAG: hypothetical protein M1829_002487 [Trizodia sp. TS-e1964]